MGALGQALNAGYVVENGAPLPLLRTSSSRKGNLSPEEELGKRRSRVGMTLSWRYRRVCLMSSESPSLSGAALEVYRC